MERPNSASYAGAGAHVEWNEDDAHQTYLPLVDHEGHLLPVHFLTMDEVCYYFLEGLLSLILEIFISESSLFYDL